MKTILKFQPYEHGSYSEEGWLKITSIVAQTLWDATHDIVALQGREALKDIFFCATERDFWYPAEKEAARNWMDAVLDPDKDHAVEIFNKMWVLVIQLPFVEEGIRQISPRYLPQGKPKLAMRDHFPDLSFEIKNPNISFVMQRIFRSLRNNEYGILTIEELEKDLIMPTTATTLSQEAINFLRRANDCYF